ncbi:AAA family ATPase [archaeon]|jgi:archaeal cell division control protein 6|nr:AAA family ATPase [archaeon]MBT4417150.1 AAA family ATPase [archaeon]
MFKEMLEYDETLFKDELVLDYEYLPKILKFRENQQQHFATTIKPLLQKRNGSNLFIYGTPGIGKTAACKHVLRELELETDLVIPLYINCWKHDTVYKILVEMCEQLKYKWVQNKKTDELMKAIAEILNQKAAVFVLDEVDKLKEQQIIYQLLEDIYKKCIFMITNDKDCLAKLDQRVKSRLLPEMLEFKPYNYDETKGILEERKNAGFFPGVFSEQAFEKIAETCFEREDIRVGIFLLKQSANNAENKSQRKVLVDHVETEKLDRFEKAKIKVDDDDKTILNIVKEKPGLSIASIYEIFSKNSDKSLRTVRRRIERLRDLKQVIFEETPTGSVVK